MILEEGKAIEDIISHEERNRNIGVEGMVSSFDREKVISF